MKLTPAINIVRVLESHGIVASASIPSVRAAESGSSVEDARIAVLTDAAFCCEQQFAEFIIVTDGERYRCYQLHGGSASRRTCRRLAHRFRIDIEEFFASPNV